MVSIRQRIIQRWRRLISLDDIDGGANYVINHCRYLGLRMDVFSRRQTNIIVNRKRPTTVKQIVTPLVINASHD
jgi:hypothetical protein